MADNYYNSSVWASGNAYIGLIEAGLTATGWTLVDAISANHHVWKSPVIAGSNAYFYLDIAWVGSLGLEVALDYDVSTHSVINASGSATGGGISTPGGQAYFYCNKQAFFLVVMDGLFNKCVWVGQPRTRQLHNETDGVCLSTASMVIGATSVAVDTDLTTRLFVGQKVAIQNFAHNSASANATHTEIVTITALAAGTLSFSATTLAYDSGAKIGPPDMLYPLGGSPDTFQSYSSGCLTLSHEAVGIRSAPLSGIGQSCVLNPGMITTFTNVLASLNESYGFGVAPESFVPCIISIQTGECGFALPTYGLIMVGIKASGGNPPAGTKYTDGTNVFVQPGASNPTGGPVVLVGPTGDTPDFNTMTRILSPHIPVTDSIYSIPPGGGGGGGTPPVISNITPTTGTTIERTDFIEFDVTDVDSDIRTVIIMARWSTEDPWEVVFDGDSFGPAYDTFSIRTVIAEGFHFKCKRALGWKSSSIDFKAVAVDVTGLEN